MFRPMVAYNQGATEKLIHRLTKNQKPSYYTNVLNKAVITSFLALCKIVYGCIPPILHCILKDINFLRMII